MCCGMNSSAPKVQKGIGAIHMVESSSAFASVAADMVKIVWHDGMGKPLPAKRFEAGKFILPSNPGRGGDVLISAAQFGCFLDKIDRRNVFLRGRPSVLSL